MRAVADDRALAAVAGIDTGRVVLATWVLSGLLAASRGRARRLVQSSVRPELRLHAAAAGLRRRRARRDRQRLRRARRRACCSGSRWSSRPGPAFFGGVDPVYKPVVAFACSIGVLLVRPQGLLGRARPRMSVARERRVLGVRRRRRRHLHDPRARAAARVRVRRPAQLRPGRVHGDRRLHDGDPRREGGLEHVARGAARRSSRRAASGVVLGLPTLRLRADYFAIVTIAFSEIVRYVATNEDRADGRLAGHDRPRRAARQASSTTASGSASRAGSRARSTSARRTSRCSCVVWAVALVLHRARLAGGPDAVGARACARSARTRTRLPRSARTCSRTSSRRSRSARRSPASPGCFYAWQFSFFSPATSRRC